MSETARHSANNSGEVPYTPDFVKIFQRNRPPEAPSPVSMICSNSSNQQAPPAMVYGSPIPTSMEALPQPQVSECCNAACQANQMYVAPQPRPPSIHPSTTPSPVQMPTHNPTPNTTRMQTSSPSLTVSQPRMPLLNSQLGPIQSQFQLNIIPNMLQPQQLVQQHQMPLIHQQQQYQQLQRHQLQQSHQLQQNPIRYNTAPSPIAAPNQIPSALQQQFRGQHNPGFAPGTSPSLPNQTAPQNTRMPTQSQGRVPTPTSQQNIRAVSQGIRPNTIPQGNPESSSSQRTYVITSHSNTQLAQMLNPPPPQCIPDTYGLFTPELPQQSIGTSQAQTVTGDYGQVRNSRYVRTYNRRPQARNVPTILRNPNICPGQTTLSAEQPSEAAPTVSCPRDVINTSRSSALTNQTPVSVSSTTRVANNPRFNDVEVQVTPEQCNKACQFDERAITMVSRALNATVDTSEVASQVEDDLPPAKTYVDRASSPINFPAPSIRRKFTAKRKKTEKDNLPIQKAQSDSDSEINVIE